MYSGYDAPATANEWYQLFQIGFGGIPGRPFGDGADGHSLWPGFTNVPNEFLESYFPLRIDIYEAIPDTGGAGKYRGGNGMHMTYRFLSRGRSRSTTTAGSPTPGASTAASRAPAAQAAQARDGTQESCRPSSTGIKVEAGDLLHFITWGGGGWGDPLLRDAGTGGADCAARPGHARRRPALRRRARNPWRRAPSG
jgi:N-methylhydantoinase B